MRLCRLRFLLEAYCIFLQYYYTQPVLILMMDMMNFWSMCLAPTAWSPDDHVVLSFA